MTRRLQTLTCAATSSVGSTAATPSPAPTWKEPNFSSVKPTRGHALGLTPEQFDLALNVDKALLPNYLAGALKRKQ